MMETRYVLFVDFLGTAEAATNWPNQRVEQFIELLTYISQMQRGEAYIRHPQRDGGTSLVVRPEVSTFSDHAVLSWPLPRHLVDDLRWGKLWPQIMCDDCASQVGAIADMALRIGLLLRGGFSLGQLYHKGGVVFGEAMVDAYRLECSVAKTPRVVVSDRIVSKVIDAQQLPTLLRDNDGQWHLDYFGEMIRTVPDAATTLEQASRWKNTHIARIDRELEILHAVGAVNAASKWLWFKERFEASNAQNRYLPPY